MTDPPAGRELDAAVAERVMGLRPCKFTNTGTISGLMNFYKCEHDSPSGCYPDDRGECLAKYSTDIAAAFKVVEHMQREGFGMVIHWADHGSMEPQYENWDVRMYGTGLPDAEGQANSVSLAICRAALAAHSALTPTVHPHTDPPAIGTEQGAQGC